MSINRARTILAACGMMLCCASALALDQAPPLPPKPSAEPVLPTFDYEDYHDFQPFAPADLSPYGGGPKPKEGFFASYERLNFAMRNPDKATIGQGSSQTLFSGAALATGGFASIQSDLSTGFLTSDPAYANRYDLGYMVDDQGWLISYMGRFRQGQTFIGNGTNVLFNDPNGLLTGFVQGPGTDQGGISDADLNGNNVYGRSGRDTGTPNTTPPPAFIPPLNGKPDTPAATDFGDLVTFITPFSTVYVQNELDVSGVELSHMWRLKPFHDGSYMEIYAGARYIDFHDTFVLDGEGGDLGSFLLDQEVKNHIVGPQIGGRYEKEYGRWSLSSEGRFMAAANFRDYTQKGSIATQFTPSQFGPLGLSAETFASSFHDVQFSPTGELRVQVAYQITKAIAFKLGYTAIGIGGVARASNTVNYTIPDLGINRAHWGEDFFMDGISAGIEINR